jgi:hypothetical protein
MRELAQEGLDGLWKGGAIVAKEKLLHLLLDLDIVAPSADFKRVRRQLASVLQVRNKLTHTGELPRLLDGYAAKDGRSVAHVIMSSIVPAIVQMALGRALGIWGGGRDEYCQSPATLREFFERGTYLGENPSKAVVFPLAT